jgi:hypothetical protein
LYTNYATANTKKQQQNSYERSLELQQVGWRYYNEHMENMNIGVEPVQNLSDIHEEIKAEALKKLKPVSSTYYYDRYMQQLMEVN